MGASSSKEEKLKSIKQRLFGQIEYNKTKLKLMDGELVKIEMEEKIAESDITKEIKLSILLLNYVKNRS